MSSFNSLELLSQAASLVQMSEEHGKNGENLIFLIIVNCIFIIR